MPGRARSGPRGLVCSALAAGVGNVPQASRRAPVRSFGSRARMVASSSDTASTSTSRIAPEPSTGSTWFRKFAS
jgi:hypothetical protein